MTNFLFSLLVNREMFWRFRAGFRWLASSVRARIFGFQHAARERKNETRIFADLLRVVFWRLVVAVAVVVALYWLDKQLRPLFAQWGWGIPMDDSYATVLTTIAGIGGVFIGLYYTALSSVSGAIYARVPNNIRDILAQDRAGNFYINLLSVLTFSCLLLVAAHVIGLGHVQSAAFVAALFAGVGIFSFAQLGRRAFNFFDPTSLSETIMEKLIQSVKMAAHPDKNFQNHAHRLAVHNISVLNTLADICAKEPHLRGGPYAQFCRGIVHLLLFYQGFRCQIPTASLWFKRKYVHKEWHTHDSTADIFHAAGMPLQPEESGDANWLEDAMLPAVRQCLRVNLEDKKWEIAHGVMSDCARIPCALAPLRQVDSAAKLVRVDGEIALPRVLPPAEDIVADERREEAGIIEQVATLPASILINYCNELKSVRKETLTEAVGKIAWHRRNAVYQPQFPPHLLPCLEELKTQIDFERQVEGKIVTPLWYQAEVVARQEADQFSANAKILFEDFPELLAEWGNIAVKSNRLWARSVIIGAEWRYHTLLGAWLNELKAAHDSITGDQRVKGMKWRTVDFPAYEKKRSERGKEIVSQMSALAPILLIHPRPEWAPDYPGQFMRCVGDAAMDALLENNIEYFRSVFVSYAVTCSQQFQRMRGKIEGQDWHALEQLRTAFTPLRDLLDLSGYACLMSELHESPALWETVTKCWDSLLNDMLKTGDSTHGMAQILVTLLRDSKLTLRRSAGDDFRFAWNRKVASQLSQIRRSTPPDWDPSSTVTTHGPFGIPEVPEEVVDHPSKLVRHCAEHCRRRTGGLGMPGGEDIFVLYYLRKHPDNKNTEFREWDHISRSIERA